MDFERSLELLWRDRGQARQPTRGRKPKLTLDRVIATAVALADGAGEATVSMSQIAKELDVGTMTLYTYVPGKTELLDLMVDSVLAARDLPGPGEPRPDGWRERVRLYADRTLAVYREHPWLRSASSVRPVLGPGLMAGQEYLIAAVADIGLPPREVTAAAQSIEVYVQANAALSAETAQIEQRTGESTDAWWGQRSVFWEKYFDVERHPAMTRMWESGGYDADSCEAAYDTFTFGLERLLDGIEARV
ncbi:TetR/AcrR family transcriptional regulator [Amycolatopsis regifaucium]|uniref:TetR family transcriptional regulator n=1 Tax=Amycolatopsis regifaucium TaxID=546365 RepID=A0A154MK56_9PSEU|nr:TetR/AcrR family transcriptional regulator [Amycolatopsis regifaucium]KZB84721.1 TetR family transcriptional regulator [Amycolatopsis regifaucium]OKA11186.1 TetR family transcriptional regulator [Amycolatopsis regifaucium]SFI27719.1 regulatory protein, tetR family [Amycolatopsis regifaucium]